MENKVSHPRVQLNDTLFSVKWLKLLPSCSTSQVNGIHQDDKSLGIDVYNLAASYTTNITSKPVFQFISLSKRRKP